MTLGTCYINTNWSLRFYPTVLSLRQSRASPPDLSFSHNEICYTFLCILLNHLCRIQFLFSFFIAHKYEFTTTNSVIFSPLCPPYNSNGCLHLIELLTQCDILIPFFWGQLFDAHQFFHCACCSWYNFLCIIYSHLWELSVTLMTVCNAISYYEFNWHCFSFNVNNSALLALFAFCAS